MQKLPGASTYFSDFAVRYLAFARSSFAISSGLPITPPEWVDHSGIEERLRLSLKTSPA
jgi:hypothetical protein